VPRSLRLTKFRDLTLTDPFFDSLKKGYREFPQWFARKANEDVYVVDDGEELSGMLYLKREDGAVGDVDPPLPKRKWLKVGTLKIVGRGTKLGERVLKKVFDTALASDAEAVYVTVFEVYDDLLTLFQRYGFKAVGVKKTDNGIEQVLVRFLTEFSGDLNSDYPFIHTSGRRTWLLAIYPEYHTRLLPDSILNNEPREIIRDVSHTNTIHKVYISGLALTRMTRGDIVLFYRTCDNKGPAYYRSVVTSLCVIEEVRQRRNFADVDEFLSYTRPRSVFSEEELREKFLTMERLSVAKMKYNSAFGKRTTRGQLLDEDIISEQPRWDMRELSREQFDRIISLGRVDARIIVD
jgi:hypothetical protein